MNSTRNIDGDKQTINRAKTTEWAYDENNPDFRLVTINAANEGFQSKMSTESGSYFVQSFITKIKNNDEINDGFCNIKHKKFLSDIIVSIQHDLESKGKQLPEFKCNNGTDKIVLIKNKNPRKKETETTGVEIALVNGKNENEQVKDINNNLNPGGLEMAPQTSTPL